MTGSSSEDGTEIGRVYEDSSCADGRRALVLAHWLMGSAREQDYDAWPAATLEDARPSFARRPSGSGWKNDQE